MPVLRANRELPDASLREGESSREGNSFGNFANRPNPDSPNAFGILHQIKRESQSNRFWIHRIPSLL